MKPKLRDSRFGEAIALLAIWLVASFPFLDPRTNVYGFDTLAYTGPNIKTTFDAWRSLDLPLWSDTMFGGVPFLGRLNSQAIYPVHLPFTFMDVSEAMDLLAALHLLILAVGMYLFVRIGWRLRPPAGLVAGAIMLSAAYTSVKMLSYEQLVALAWIPWVFLFVELILRHPIKLNLAGPLGLVLSCLLLGSHPQTVYIAAFGLVGYVGFRLLDTKSIRGLATMCLAATLSVTACILQFVAAYFLGKSSAIGGKRSLEVLDQPAYVLNARNALLGVFGDQFSRDPSSASGSGEAILGVGSLAVGLAIIGLCAGRQLSIRTRWALFLGTAVSVLLAMGPDQILFRIFHRVVPGFGLARVAGRWLLIALVFVALLAAVGADSLARRELRRRESQLVVFGSAVALFAISLPYFIEPRGATRMWWLVGLLVPVAAVVAGQSRLRTGALLLPIVGILAVGSVAPLLNSPPTNLQFDRGIDEVSTPLLEGLGDDDGRIYAQTFDRFDNFPYLIANLRPNAHALFGLRSIDGYDGGQWVQRRWVTSMRSLAAGSFNTDLTLRSQVRGPLEADEFARFGVRWVLIDNEVVPASGQLKGWVGPLRQDGTVELWENPEWIGNGVLYFSTELRERRVPRQLRDVPQGTAIVESADFRISCDRVGQQCDREAATETRRSRSSGRFDVEVGQQAVLAIDQAWSKDWVVKVDGRRVTTQPVNVNQLGVLLQPGRHVITYEYSPRWYLPTFVMGWLGAFSLIFLTASWSRDVFRERRGSGNPNSSL